MFRILTHARYVPYRSFIKVPEKTLENKASVIKQKGKGDEDNYIRKIERNFYSDELVQNLSKKLKDLEDHPTPPLDEDEVQRAHLLSLASKHNLRLPEVVLEDIVAWKLGKL